MSHPDENDPAAPDRLQAVVSRQSYPLIIVTISGAHL